MSKALKYPMTPEFETAFERFYERCRYMAEAENAKYVGVACHYELSYEIGKRYVKLIRVNGSAQSAYCFVDKANGDIYKCASWLAPAKGARGSIYSGDCGIGAMTPYGAKYLKGGKF